ncbi:MAG TPA: hypothetical protein VGN23_10155 [Verrucomicrobiae bacterium]|jgi:hypothetical protein
MSSEPAKSRAYPNFWLMAALLLLPLMITGESLWLDEGGTAMYALQPDLHSWWQHLNEDTGSDSEMPLSLFVAWMGGKLLGTAEWQLRVVNLIWGALALVAFARAGRKLRIPWLPFFMAIQPYFWFYMNEARPYALQIAGGAWLLVAFLEYIECKGAGNSWAWLFAIAALVLCLTTILAPLPIAAALIALGIMTCVHQWRINQRALLILIAGAVACIPAGIFYLSTVARGAKGAQVWHFSPACLGYVIYELTGMSGLGPSIDSLRAIAQSAGHISLVLHHPWQFLLPAIGLFVLLLVFVIGLCRGLSDERRLVGMAIVIVLVITSLGFVIGSVCLHRAFWARHFAPVFPFYTAIVAMAVAGLISSRQWLVRILPWLLMALLLYSSLNLRFAPAYRKENYRGAVQFARSALEEKKSVWWVAGWLLPTYYHLDLSAQPESGRLYDPEFAPMENLAMPDFIIMSRPETFDPAGGVRNIIQSRHYQLVQTNNAFTIWTSPGK